MWDNINTGAITKYVIRSAVIRIHDPTIPGLSCEACHPLDTSKVVTCPGTIDSQTLTSLTEYEHCLPEYSTTIGMPYSSTCDDFDNTRTSTCTFSAGAFIIGKLIAFDESEQENKKKFKNKYHIVHSSGSTGNQIGRAHV